MSQVPRKIRMSVYRRDGFQCVRCGETWGLQVHHRRLKGMGGDKREHTDCACNLITVCHSCHVPRIHGDRQEAEAFGYIVSRLQELPGEVGVMRFSDAESGVTSWPDCQGGWAA